MPKAAPGQGVAMERSGIVGCLMALAVCAAPGGAWAAGALPGGVDPSLLCRAAVLAAEAAQRVPQAFLLAIARVESGRADPQTGTAHPWPWTVNAEGTGTFYDSKAAAIAGVQALQARGVRSIDVGCLQVNLLQHPAAFASLDQAFDPAANAAYAAGFLNTLFAKVGSWPLAAAAYHSQTPTVGAPYEKRVLAEWAVPEAARGQHVPARAPAPEPAAAPTRPVPPAAPGGVRLAALAPMGRMAPYVQRTPAAAGIAGTGRSLAAYRLMPARLALRAGGPG